MKLKDLKLNDRNPRRISEAKLTALKKSITDFEKMLSLRPIVVDETNTVLGGNMRLRALQALGYKEIPDEWVRRADDLTEEEKRQFIIKDNVGFGEWDWDALANEWDAGELAEWGLDVPDMWGQEVEAQEDDFEIPDVVHTDIVPGDLIEIGRHRLLCGDSTSADDVERLMGGIKADMVFTDPPYGIKIVSNSSVGGGGAVKFGGKKGKVVKSTTGFSEIQGDDTTDAAREFYHTCISLGFENFIIWGGNYFTDFLPPSMGWIVWYKKNTGNFADFEMAWTSYEKAAKLYEYLWNGLSREGSRVLELKKRVHPTQKPVGLSINILKDYDWQVCYDGFLGSGTTMVAAHQLNRTCYGMEIDPKYCQVIIDRMIKLDQDLEVKINGNEYGTPKDRH